MNGHEWDRTPLTPGLLPYILPALCRKCGVSSEKYYGEVGLITVAERDRISAETTVLLGSYKKRV